MKGERFGQMYSFRCVALEGKQNRGQKMRKSEKGELLVPHWSRLHGMDAPWGDGA